MKSKVVLLFVMVLPFLGSLSASENASHAYSSVLVRNVSVINVSSGASKVKSVLISDHKLGNIQKGMLADLVLLSSNPLVDIRNTNSIEAVIKDGTVYTRADLDEMLEKLEAEN